MPGGPPGPTYYLGHSPPSRTKQEDLPPWKVDIYASAWRRPSWRGGAWVLGGAWCRRYLGLLCNSKEIPVFGTFRVGLGAERPDSDLSEHLGTSRAVRGRGRVPRRCREDQGGLPGWSGRCPGWATGAHVCPSPVYSPGTTGPSRWPGGTPRGVPGARRRAPQGAPAPVPEPLLAGTTGHCSPCVPTGQCSRGDRTLLAGDRTLLAGRTHCSRVRNTALGAGDTALGGGGDTALGEWGRVPGGRVHRRGRYIPPGGPSSWVPTRWSHSR